MANRPKLIVCAVLAGLCIVVYGQTLWHGFVEYDDRLFITANPAVYGGLTWESVRWAFTNTYAPYVIPLTWLTHIADCEVYGLAPWGHHLTNLLIHTANTILLFLVLARLTRNRREPIRFIDLLPCALAAALFAVHPLNVESVAMVSERKGILSFFFWILAVGAYGWYVDRPNLRRYLLVAGLFVLGLLSRPTVLVLPLILLLLDYWPLGRIHAGAGRVGRPSWCSAIPGRVGWLILEKTPLMVLSVGFSVATAILLERNEGPLAATFSFSERMGSTVAIYSFYLEKLFWPVCLAVHYPYPVEGLPAAYVAASAVLLAGITVTVLVFLRRFPFLAVGWLWYGIALFPMCSLLKVASYLTADRYAYATIIGLFIMIAWSAATVVERRPRCRFVVAVSAMAVIAGLAVCAGFQTRHWRNNMTLFEHNVRVVPDSQTAQNNFALSLLGEGRIDDAIAHFEQALALPGPFKQQPHTNLGNLMAEMGRLDEAAQHYIEVLALDPANHETYLKLGALMAKQGKLEAAADYFRNAIRTGPNDAAAHNNLGLALAVQKRYEEALGHYEQAVALDSGYANAYANMAQTLVAMGRVEEAVRAYEKVIKIDPANRDAYFNIGAINEALGHIEEAVRYYEKTVALDPGDAETQARLDHIRASHPGS